jgi:hypothetical protein
MLIENQSEFGGEIILHFPALMVWTTIPALGFRRSPSDWIVGWRSLLFTKPNCNACNWAIGHLHSAELIVLYC